MVTWTESTTTRKTGGMVFSSKRAWCFHRKDAKDAKVISSFAFWGNRKAKTTIYICQT